MPLRPCVAGLAHRDLRKIIHIDMDCFYAAVEIREQPELADKPVAVGGRSKRGVLTTCNYIARRYGCRSAMPVFKALELCPELICLPVRFDLYRKVSRQIREVFVDYTELIEPLSLDEAFLDVSHSDRYAWDIAKEIRARIRDELQLTASAGVAPNKLLAKIASDWRKPDGQFAVTPDTVGEFMRDLPVRKLWGIGPKSAEKLKGHGIETCGDMQRYDSLELQRLVGSFGEELYRQCRGMDDRPVQPHRVRKSLSNERTFGENLTSLEAATEAIGPLFEELLEDLAKDKVIDRPIGKAVVKVKFADFQQTTKECVCHEPKLEVYERLLAEAWERGQPSVRLLGLGVRFADVTERRDRRQLEMEPLMERE